MATNASSPPPPSSDDVDDECEHFPLSLLEFKFVFVGCVGAAVAVVSLINNLMLLHAFLTSHREMSSRRNLIYLTGLSVCDIVISFFYLFIMSMQVYAEYFELATLFALWHHCLPLAFTLSNITATAASFLLMAAAIERYLLSVRSGCATAGFMLENRKYAALVAVLLAVVMKGTILFEIEVYHIDSCEGMGGRGVKLSAMAQNPIYDSVWRFWTRRIVTIFLPFFILAYCNFMIVYSTERAEYERAKIHRAHNTVTIIIVKRLSIHRKVLFSVPSSEKAAAIAEIEEKQRAERRRRFGVPRIRSSTRMLIIVVGCYLVANSVDVMLAAWEYFDAKSLSDMSDFYTVATDVSSLLSVCSSALRLPIYIAAGDKLLKAEIRRSFDSLWRTVTCASRRNSDFSALGKLRDTFFLLYQPLIVIVKHQNDGAN